MNHDPTSIGVFEGAGERGASGRYPAKAVLLEPAGEIDLARVLPVRMDANLADRFRPEQMHRVGQHHRALMEVPVVRLARRRPGRRRPIHNQVIERHG